LENISRNYYKDLLLQQKSEVEQRIRNYEINNRLSLKETTGELSSYDNHPADQGSNTFEREKDRGLQDGNLVLLRRINLALDLLENNQYGQCQNCGQEIDNDRLQLIPYILVCRHCVEEEEALIEFNDRPVEEEVIKSFADTGDGSFFYSGEDSWRDVSSYGTSNTPADDMDLNQDQEDL